MKLQTFQNVNLFQRKHCSDWLEFHFKSNKELDALYKKLFVLETYSEWTSSQFNKLLKVECVTVLWTCKLQV